MITQPIRGEPLGDKAFAALKLLRSALHILNQHRSELGSELALTVQTLVELNMVAVSGLGTAACPLHQYLSGATRDDQYSPCSTDSPNPIPGSDRASRYKICLGPVR
jgi:hypothetical protein